MRFYKIVCLNVAFVGFPITHELLTLQTDAGIPNLSGTISKVCQTRVGNYQNSFLVTKSYLTLTNFQIQ